MSSRRIRTQESTLFRQLMSAFAQWLPEVARAVTITQQLAPEQTFSTVAQWRRQVRQMLPTLRETARIGSSEAFGTVTFSSNRFFVLEALDAGQNMLSNIPDQVHQRIIDEIAIGLDRGDSHSTIRQKVANMLTVAGSDLWKNRAGTISVTETTRAANAGALAAAQVAQQDVGSLFKRWNDESDTMVRQSHKQVDGNVVPLLQPFDVNGSMLLYPADPSGAPDQVVGCRCDLSFQRTLP